MIRTMKQINAMLDLINCKAEAAVAAIELRYGGLTNIERCDWMDLFGAMCNEQILCEEYEDLRDEMYPTARSRRTLELLRTSP